MQTPLSPLTHFLPVTLIRRTRLLPVPGKVVVRRGQKVNATDVVAEARLNKEHLLLDLVRGLGLPAAKTDAVLQRQAGEDVSEGDVIAGPVGLGRRVVRAPRNGRVVVAGGGQVLLELSSRPFELKAGLPGTVVDLVNERGVQIETTGALLQGVWGNGREDSQRIETGLLSIMMSSPQDTLTNDRLDVSLRGLVLVTGHVADPAVFTTGTELPIRGMVIGSMPVSLMETALKMPYPIILLEGFGKIAMNQTAFRLLSTSDRREAAINAEPWDQAAGTRPEVIITLPASTQASFPNELGSLAAGKQARVIAPPFRGASVTVVGVRPGLSTLPSGVRAQVADVRFESGGNAVVPVANLEALD